MDARYGRVKWGKGQARSRTGAENWKKTRQWNKAAEGTAVRPRVFCASMADWLDEEVPIEWLADLLTLIHDTSNLDWLLLTKRPENWRERMEKAGACWGNEWQRMLWLEDWLKGQAPENVWIGTSVEDQTRADERLPILCTIPARIRFLSCEPLLGPVDVSDYLDDLTDGGYVPGSAPIQWVICGGESGPGARPMAAEWARGLRDQCTESGTAFFFKQWGAFDSRGEQVGKKRAGRELDGREWSELPEGISGA